MQRNNLVFKQSTLDTEKIVFEDFDLTDDEQYAVSKIWYQENNSAQPHTLFIQPENLRVYEITKNNDIILELLGNNYEMFEELDKLSVNVVKSSGVIKKYGMKDVKYKTIINELDTDSLKKNTKKINALRLKIVSTNTNNTKFFVGDRLPKSIDDVRKLLTRGTEIKIIIELEELIIDLKNSTIFTNIILKQALIKKMKPCRAELCEYSFVESDCEKNEQLRVSPPNKDTMLNTQTEYLDQNTATSEKTKTSKKKMAQKSDSEKTKQQAKQLKQQVASQKSDESESEEKINDTSCSDEGSIDVENFMMSIRNRK